MRRVTTASGAVYRITDDGIVTGGSRNLRRGRLIAPIVPGRPMLIQTPERADLFPDFRDPGIITSTVVTIEEVDEW